MQTKLEKEKEKKEKLAELTRLNALSKKWNVIRERSQFDDSLSVFLSAVSNERYQGTLNRPTRAKLWVRCMENTTAFMIDWDMFISTQAVTVTYRVDDNQAQKKRLNVTTDYKSTGLFSGGDSISLFGHDKLLVQVTPHSEAPRAVNFDIAGLEDAIDPLRKSCRW